MNYFSEEYTQAQIVQWFQAEDYTVIERCVDNPIMFDDINDCQTHETFGIDVVAKKETDLWIIEVKGETKGNRSAAVSNFHYGLGQILTRMTTVSENIHYGLAIPNSDNFAAVVRKTMNSQALLLLNLSLILVQNYQNIVFVNQ